MPAPTIRAPFTGEFGDVIAGVADLAALD
jgi:hypothetical protein